MLRVNKISKRFGNTLAVDSVSLEVAAGDIVCLLGPSGCGKTTLLRLVAGLESADSGNIHMQSRDLTTTPPHKRQIGMMFQDFALFPHMTVAQNVGYGLKMRGDSAESIQNKVVEMLALIDLQTYGQRSIDQLSGGEKQRVALARALATNPRLLMLDEPLGALDRRLRERLMIDLRAILKQVGVTALYVTHDQSEAFAIADQIAVMNDGQLEQLAPPQLLYSRPATPFVARFLGFENIVDGIVEGDRVVLTELAPDWPANTSARKVLIPPDCATVVWETVSAETDHLVLKAIVINTTFRGRYSQLRVEIGAQKLTFEVESDTGLETGKPVTLLLNESKFVPLN